jgi:hypothetical protein
MALFLFGMAAGVLLATIALSLVKSGQSTGLVDLRARAELDAVERAFNEGPVEDGFPLAKEVQRTLVNLGEEVQARKHLELQLLALGRALFWEYGGPRKNETAVDMALRLLREAKEQGALKEYKRRPHSSESVPRAG